MIEMMRLCFGGLGRSHRRDVKELHPQLDTFLSYVNVIAKVDKMGPEQRIPCLRHVLFAHVYLISPEAAGYILAATEASQQVPPRHSTYQSSSRTRFPKGLKDLAASYGPGVTQASEVVNLLDLVVPCGEHPLS
jgi:hypothetical protein